MDILCPTTFSPI